MTVRLAIILISCGLAAGCASWPDPSDPPVVQAAHRYATITLGMRRPDVIAALGPATEQHGPTQLRWETRNPAGESEALEVFFDGADRVDFLKRISSRTGKSAAVSSAQTGAPPVYHDYDYGWDGNVRPYPPARLKK
jgi:hypothetical protein